MNLVTFLECVESADEALREGATIFQKFKCAKCGTTQTFEIPNAFYKLGQCEECKHITNIVKDGCNYIAIYSNNKEMLEKFLSDRKHKNSLS